MCIFLIQVKHFNKPSYKSVSKHLSGPGGAPPLMWEDNVTKSLSLTRTHTGMAGRKNKCCLQGTNYELHENMTKATFLSQQNNSWCRINETKVKLLSRTKYWINFRTIIMLDIAYSFKTYDTDVNVDYLVFC